MQTTFAKHICNTTFDADAAEEEMVGTETKNEGSDLYKLNTELYQLSQETSFMTCPNCKKGQLKLKPNRYGTLFIACTDWPTCKNTMSFLKKGVENIEMQSKFKCETCTQANGSDVHKFKIKIEEQVLAAIKKKDEEEEARLLLNA